MDVQQQINAIIDLLETARKRKAMYFQPVDGTAASNFVCGISSVAYALGIEGRREAWWKAIEKRGWKVCGVGPLPAMQERGMTDEQIADEVLAIEVEAWQIQQATAALQLP